MFRLRQLNYVSGKGVRIAFFSRDRWGDGRWIFGGTAALILISIILILAFIPKWNHQKDESLKNPLKPGSLADVWKNKFFISVIPMGLFNYGGLMAIQTLWAGPWMIRVAGYTPLESATGLFWINITMLVSFFFMGLFFT